MARSSCAKSEREKIKASGGREAPCTHPLVGFLFGCSRRRSVIAGLLSVGFGHVFALLRLAIPVRPGLVIHARVRVDPDHASAVYRRGLLLSRGWLGSRCRATQRARGGGGGIADGSSRRVWCGGALLNCFSLVWPRYRHFFR